MPCAVGRGGDPRDAVRRWRALSAGITRRVGEAEGDRAAGRFPRSCGRVGRRVRLSCERSGLRDAAREGEACGRATSARYNGSIRVHDIQSSGQRDRVYYSL